MHTRALFRTFHAVHHLSTNPTPWTAYSFHPLESVVQALGVVLIIFIMPSHPLALIIFQTISTAINVYGHLGYEIYPRSCSRHWLGRWINTSVAHNLHHKTARHNFGFYFLFWDRLMGRWSRITRRATSKRVARRRARLWRPFATRHASRPTAP